MQTVRKALARLGWPVGSMTDKQIKIELYRRWFASQPEDTETDAPLTMASAGGIFTALAAEGNLDVLGWSPEDVVPSATHVEVLAPSEQALFLRGNEEQDYAGHERRRAAREPARELIGWHSPLCNEEASTGWLVDRSATGLAFIAPANAAPVAGQEIIPTLHARTGGSV
ncbi:MAG: hypothetical protein GXY44_12710, partial [Phycisphaerales bacterium]|nr:hypothetical protein [Phycisphaerales bacterium]